MSSKSAKGSLPAALAQRRPVLNLCGRIVLPVIMSVILTLSLTVSLSEYKMSELAAI